MYLKLLCNYIYVHTETHAHIIITRKPESRDGFQIMRVRIHDKWYTIHNKNGVDEWVSLFSEIMKLLYMMIL